jgi:hypothetical protein
MMTTMAALLGGCRWRSVPARIGTAPAAGHHHRRRLIFSQLLTLYTTPVIYLFFDRLAQPLRTSRAPAPKGAGAAGTAGPAPAAGEVSDEHLRAIHPQTGRHHAADRRDRALRRGRLPLLPVSPLPQVDFPTISVSAALPGASPETMASSVATPLERQFGHIAAVTEMTSSSSLGSTSITLQFDLNRDIDAAARDVESAINAARGYCRPTCPAIPATAK